VVSLASGKAVALHFAGRMFVKNHAVPVDVVADRLEQVFRKRPSGGESQSVPIPARKSSSPSSRFIDATIPIHVRIELGEISTGNAPISISAAPSPKPAETVRDDEDEIDLSEGRPEDYVDRDGYNADFLGIEVPLPSLTRNTDDILTYEFENETHSALTYRHFSVLMSKSRRQCRFSACNINGRLSKRTARKGWLYDPRIPRESQIMKECYGNAPKFSRGHMTRREDPAWGEDEATAMEGNVDSMHVTNAVPQIQPFNAGIWLRLEDYALDNAREDEMRISVFTGPFFSDDGNDEEESTRFGVQIPVKFWKVIAFLHEETGALAATGYTMSQRTFIGDDEIVFGQHESHQRPIAEIEARAGISFGPLAEVDGMRDVPESAPTLLTDPRQIRWG
jgi:endonuclease G